MPGKYIWDLEVEKKPDKYEQKKKVREEKITEAIKKEKRERLLERKRAEHRKKVKRRKIIRRTIKVMIILLTVIITGLFLFFPFFNYQEMQIINSNHYNKETLLPASEFDEKYNLIQVVLIKHTLENKQLIGDVHLDIKIKEKKIEYQIEEKQILGYNESGKLEMVDNGQIIQVDGDYDAPLIIGLTDEEKVQLADQFKQLSYNIYTQIESVQKKTEDGEQNEIVLEMKDGNTVYIYIQDIAYKMNYYQQIKSIIDQNGDGPGYIYLDIGDYYEPK